MNGYLGRGAPFTEGEAAHQKEKGGDEGCFKRYLILAFLAEGRGWTGAKVAAGEG